MDINKTQFSEFIKIRLEGLQDELIDNDDFNIKMITYGQVAIWENLLTRLPDIDTETDLREALTYYEENLTKHNVGLYDMDRKYCMMMKFTEGKFKTICEVYKYISEQIKSMV